MRIDENLWKDKGNLESNSPYYECAKAIVRLGNSDPKKVFEVLADFVKNAEEQSAKTTLFHWIAVLNLLDEFLKKRIDRHKVLLVSASSPEGRHELLQNQTEISLILDFTHALLKKSRNRSVYSSAELLVEVMRLDDWSLVVKALRTVAGLLDISSVLRSEPREQKAKEMDEWLLNIAFGYSLKSDKKLSFIDILHDKTLINGELYFQYYNMVKDPPTITIIKIPELYKDSRSSEEIAKDIAAKNSVPQELFNALWCKVRLAKTVVSEEIKDQVVMASLVAYIAFETEPKVKLIPNVIQLLKENVSAQIHCTAFEVLTALLYSEYNNCINIDLFPTVINQIAILSPNGFIQAILKDLTAIQLVPVDASSTSPTKYRAVLTPELLPKTTVGDSSFALSVLNFLASFERSIVRSHSPFMSGLNNALCNFLLMPVDDHYPYYVPVLTKAMVLLNMFMHHNAEEYSATDSIISRLCLELRNLGKSEKELRYAERQFDNPEMVGTGPKVEHRQELCKSLFKLLSSSIHLSVQGNPSVQNALNGRAAEMQRSLDQQRRAAHQRRQGQRPGQRVGSVSQEEQEPEEELKDDSIAVSRRVLESKLIELCVDVFNSTARGTSKACDSVSYAALALVANVIKDIPTCVPDLAARGLVKAVVDCYYTRIPMEENYLRDILRGLNAIVLHHEGCEIVSNKKIVYPILQSLIKEDYAMVMGPAHSELYEEPARQLLSLYSQAESLRPEIVKGIQNFFLGLFKKCEVLIQKLAEAIQLERKTGSAAKKEEVLEEGGRYLQALKGILYFTVSLIQNEESNDHKKLLAAINADCELIRSILQLFGLASVLGIYLKGVKKTQAHFAIIIRHYIGDIFSNKENSEIIMKIVGERLNQIIDRLGPIDKLVDLSEFVYGKRPMKFDKDDILGMFPPDDQMIILLNSVENTCEVIKTLGVSWTDFEATLGLLTEIHKLILREVIRLSREGKSDDVIKFESADEESKRLKDAQGMDTFTHYNLPSDSEYKTQLDQTYQQVRKSFLLIIKSVTFRRRLEQGGEEKFAAVSRAMGKIMSQNIAELIPNVGGIHTFVCKRDRLCHLLYYIMTLDDVRLSLLHESSMGQLAYDFTRGGGLSNLFELYQLVINEYQKCKNEKCVEQEVVDGLEMIISLLMGTFEKLLDPAYTKRQTQVIKPSQLESPFKTTEDYLASFLVHVWETLLFKTQYGPYGSCVRFLAECNRKGFESFLNVLKRSGDRKSVLQSLSYDSSRARRGMMFYRYPLLSEANAEQLNLGGRPFPRPQPEVTTAQVAESIPPETPSMRKIEAKELGKELDKLFGYILGSLYEALYSVSSYKCKKLLFSLVESQETATLYKSENLFVQLLNELQTLLFGLEFSFEANLIPVEESANFPDLVEMPLTPQLKELMEKAKSADYTEDRIISTAKISVLVDLILTFVKQTKKPALMHILCENRMSRILVTALSVVCTKDKVWHNKELVPKILMLLSMVYKETFANLQLQELEEELAGLGISPESKPSQKLVLPSVDEVKKLMQIFANLVDMDEAGEKSDPGSNVLVTSEVLALIVLLLYSLTKSYELANEVLNSGIIAKLCILKSRPDRDNVPTKLFINVIFNLFESPDILCDYMKRVITSALFAKIDTKFKDEKSKKTDPSDMQKKGVVLLDDFVENMKFLSNRNPRIFVKACKEVLELHKETSKKGTKDHTKLTVALTKEVIVKTMHDKKQKLPEIPLNSPQMHLPGKAAQNSSPKDTPEDKNLKEYKSLLQSARKSSLAMKSKMKSEVVTAMLERLIELHFALVAHSEAKSGTDAPCPVITEEIILEAIGELARVYPEVLWLILTFKSAGHSKISGTTLVSFLLRSVFPSRYVKEVKASADLGEAKIDWQVVDDEPWRNQTLQFVKNVTYEAKSLLTAKHRILLAEMRRRMVLELLTILSAQSTEKRQGDGGHKSLSLLYSSLSLFEGLLSNVENSIIYPLTNVHQIIRLSLSTPNFSLIKLCMDILKGMNMNSFQAELLSAKLVKILERLTRFNTQKSKPHDKKEDTNVLMPSEESEGLQNLHINPMVRELAEREQELEAGEGESEADEGESESMHIYSDEYVENQDNQDDAEEGFSGEDAEGAPFGIGSNGSYEDSDQEEDAEEAAEGSVPMQLEGEDQVPGEVQIPGDDDEDEDDQEEIPVDQEEAEVSVEADEGEEILSEGESAGRSEVEMEESLVVNDMQPLQAEEWAMMAEDDESDESNVIRVIPPERADMLRQLGESEFGLHFGVARDQGANAARIGIDAPPGQLRESSTARIADIYERATDEAVNNQIVPQIRPETLGEEESGPARSGHRIFLQMMHDSDVPIFVSRSEEEKKRDLSGHILYGEGKLKDAVSDLIKKQLTNGALAAFEVMADEEEDKKMEEKVEGGKTDGVAEQAKAEEKKEVKPEEKKEEEMKQIRLCEESKGAGAEKPKKEEEKKVEEKKKEEKKAEEKKELPKPSEEFLAKRRAELASIIPTAHFEQVEDSLLTQIDPDFLRALPEHMRLQAVEPFIRRARRVTQEIAPETFLGSITDENLQNEILLGADERFLSALPQDMVRRAEALRRGHLPWSQRHHEGGDSEEKKEAEEEPEHEREQLEEYLLAANGNDFCEREIIDAVASALKSFDDKSIENLLKLLYLNIVTKIPINALVGNVCYAKQLVGRILDALIFMLVYHPAYEAQMRAVPKLTGPVSKIPLSDTGFPPTTLYNGMELSHLAYYILPLRILALLSHLLRVPYVIRYLLPKDFSKPVHLSSLGSIKKLRKQFAPHNVLSPLSEILSLVENSTFRSSVVHLETFIQFIIDLFKHYEENLRKGETTPPLIDNMTVRQMCRIFFLEAQTDKSCNKLIELLTKLSFVEKNAVVIIEEAGQTIESICQELLKDWRLKMKDLEEHRAPKMPPDHGQDEISLEYKLGRLITLLRGLYKGHTKKEVEEDVRPFKFVFEEDDSIGEFSPLSKKLQVELEEGDKLSVGIRKRVLQLYERPTLVNTFDCLTDLLSCITREGGKFGGTVKNQLLFKLVPAIEALIIAYNHIFNDPQKSREFMKELRDARGNKDFVFTNKMAHALYKFLRHNDKTINGLIRQLEIQSFLSLIKPFIVRFPYFLDFDNKRTYFRNELRKLHKRSTLKLTVSRNNIFVDSYNQLSTRTPDEMMGKLKVTFRGEQAVDAGGVTREWYTCLSKAMFNPDFCLFKRSAHGNTYQPDPKSVIEANYLQYFRFIGRIIGKALLDGMYLDCFFTRAFYKIIVGQTLNIHDLEDSDIELYKGLEWLRDNDAALLDSTFSYTLDYFGEIQVRELIENGKNVPVTNENKHDFIVRMCKAKLYEEIKPQMEALLKGLYELVPRKMISIFGAKEIELLISGLPDIDILDLKRNTEYYGYTEHSDIIKWLWETLESYSSRERAQFLQFVTGTSKVPLEGFKSLPGAVGIQKFQIHRVHGDAERLPTAHTWYEQVV